MKVDFFMDLDPSSVNHNPMLSLDLPLMCYRCGFYKANSKYFTTREGMDSYLLLLTVSGHGFLDYKGMHYELSAGDAVMINCVEYQSYGTFGDRWEFYWAHFGGPAVEYYQNIINFPNNSPVHLDDKNGVYWFNEIFRLIKNQTQRPDLMLCTYLTHLMTELASARLNPMNNPSYRRYRDEVAHLIRYINEHLNESITLDELSGMTHLSKFYLIRLFKAYTGKTPHEYILYNKILEAKRLLTTSDATVAEIASQTGFHDSNHLVASFKKLTGTTPLMYRKLWSI